MGLASAPQMPSGPPGLSRPLSMRHFDMSVDVGSSGPSLEAGFSLPNDVNSAISTSPSLVNSAGTAGGSARSTSDGKVSSLSAEQKANVIGDLRGVPIILPPESKRDRVHFIFNNVSEETLPVKTKDLSKIEKEYIPWLATYILKRISTEPNQTDLYLKFVGHKTYQWGGLLHTFLLAASYREAKKIMTSQTILSSAGERIILKNVGSLIGRLTLGKNRPILRKDMCLKQLLIISYESGMCSENTLL
jgi:CCR4-NOT transcription complex subunit 1